MIRGSIIGHQFSEVYASGFLYDHEGIARFPALAVNYTTKTQFLFRISKGTREVWDRDRVNHFIPDEDRDIPFTNIVFIGDGETDIPCFRLVKSLGGHSIAVFPARRKGARNASAALLDQGRVNFSTLADYSEGSQLDKIMKGIIRKISADTALKKIGLR